MSFKRFIFILLMSCMFFLPYDTFAEGIMPTIIRVKNSDNTQVLADQSLDFFTNSPYYSTQIELPFSSPTLQYNTSYGIDMYVDFYVSYYNDWGNFGLNSPGIYINYNGLHSQTLNYNSFNNEFVNVSNVVGWYRLHLSGTFATNSQGALYIALPFSHAIDLYGAKVVSVDLNYYGSNTTNSDIIASNNQNTQNIITNNNQNTQNINNHIDSIGNQLVDNTTLSDTDVQDYLDSLPPMGWGSISNIVTLPIYILNVFISWFDQPCSSISLGSLLNKNITLACYDVSSKLGNVYTYIDVIFACFVYYNLLMFIVGVYDSWTSFNDDFEGLYVGKHTPEGYSPRHGGGK